MFHNTTFYYFIHFHFYILTHLRSKMFYFRYLCRRERKPNQSFRCVIPTKIKNLSHTRNTVPNTISMFVTPAQSRRRAISNPAAADMTHSGWMGCAFVQPEIEKRSDVIGSLFILKLCTQTHRDTWPILIACCVGHFVLFLCYSANDETMLEVAWAHFRSKSNYIRNDRIGIKTRLTF